MLFVRIREKGDVRRILVNVLLATLPSSHRKSLCLEELRRLILKIKPTPILELII